MQKRLLKSIKRKEERKQQNKEFWTLGIHPFNSPLPKAQNRKSYFALFYKKEDQKETNNKEEKELHRLTRHIWLQKNDLFVKIKDCHFSFAHIFRLCFYIFCTLL